MIVATIRSSGRVVNRRRRSSLIHAVVLRMQSERLPVLNGEGEGKPTYPEFQGIAIIDIDQPGGEQDKSRAAAEALRALDQVCRRERRQVEKHLHMLTAQNKHGHKHQHGALAFASKQPHDCIPESGHHHHEELSHRAPCAAATAAACGACSQQHATKSARVARKQCTSCSQTRRTGYSGALDRCQSRLVFGLVWFALCF